MQAAGRVAVSLGNHGLTGPDRYFMDRNEHFQEHPHRAGDKIWRVERTPPNFDPSNSCKDPAYR